MIYEEKKNFNSNYVNVIYWFYAAPKRGLSRKDREKKMLVASFRKKNSEKDIWDDEMTLEPGEKNIIKCFEILFNALALQWGN